MVKVAIALGLSAIINTNSVSLIRRNIKGRFINIILTNFLSKIPKKGNRMTLRLRFFVKCHISFQKNQIPTPNFSLSLLS